MLRTYWHKRVASPGLARTNSPAVRTPRGLCCLPTNTDTSPPHSKLPAGFELTIQPTVHFVEQTSPRGRAVSVPTSLPRLPIEQALATVALPLHLNW